MFRVLALLGLLFPLTVGATDNKSDVPVEALSDNKRQLEEIPNIQSISIDQKNMIDQKSTVDKIAPQKLQANIVLHTLPELEQLLIQAEEISSNEDQYNLSEPIAVVLHGEEIRAFIRSNYRMNKELIDRAARLDAFKVIDLKVCQRWMGKNGIMVTDLPAFLDQVPFGADEKESLQRSGYAYF